MDSSSDGQDRDELAEMSSVKFVAPIYDVKNSAKIYFIFNQVRSESGLLASFVFRLN